MGQLPVEYTLIHVLVPRFLDKIYLCYCFVLLHKYIFFISVLIFIRSEFYYFKLQNKNITAKCFKRKRWTQSWGCHSISFIMQKKTHTQNKSLHNNWLLNQPIQFRPMVSRVKPGDHRPCISASEVTCRHCARRFGRLISVRVPPIWTNPARWRCPRARRVTKY